jgi:hypothetical protein
LAVLWAGAPSAPAAFTLLSSNQLVYVNVDHAPVGTCSTITYGLNGPSGPYWNINGAWCGLGTSSPEVPYWPTYAPAVEPGGGVVIALAGSGGVQTMPFLVGPWSVSSNAAFFPTASAQRTLTAGTDQWSIPGAGLSFTHYSPAWFLPSLSAASLSDKKRFFLPATWITLTVNNTNTTREDLYFGLPTNATQMTFANGAYQGFARGEAALAVQSGTCDLLSGSSLASLLNGLTQGFAFHISIPAGQTRSLTAVIAYYRSAVVDTRVGGYYYYTSLFPSMDSVIDAAFAGFADVQARCQQLATAMANAGLNPFRQFLASHAMHSYQADTTCLVDASGNVYWRVPEGFYDYINTFDLTVDLAFYESLMYPWALRNVLDTMSGAINGAGYTYDTPLYNPSDEEVSSQGFSFYHDMGYWPTSLADSAYYNACMGDEELQSWILSAGLYWSHTADNAWLTNNAALLRTCLDSMLARDNTNAAACDGITKNLNSGEITTFDDIDPSLNAPAYSGRLAVRNWACYLALEAMFGQMGDEPDAGVCETMAATAAQTVVSCWNANRSNLGYIPALLNGANDSAVILLVEGLAYPAQMGLTNAIDRVGGPYAAMLQALSNHLAAVLVPGRCLDPTTGAWMMTSVPWKTWQSKIYIAQYVAERVLGFTGDTIDGAVDQVHATIQIQNAPFHEWSDECDCTGQDRTLGGCHYPRGITGALWWLSATNNPAYPAPTAAPAAPTGLTALPGNQQVVLLWNGVALASGYNLKRATISGGPYNAVTNALTGASFTDTGLSNYVTYYYVVTATNQVGESLASAQASAMPYPPVPASPTSVALSATANRLTVSWPPNYVGWLLQTNALDVSNHADWGDVPGSQTNSQMTFPTIPPAPPREFFRLRHP